MRPHPTIRTTIKWGGAAVTVLLFVLWLGSVWWQLGWDATTHTSIECRWGRVHFSYTVGWFATHDRPIWLERASSILGDDSRMKLWYWWIHESGRTGLYILALPLWPFIAATFCATAIAWRLDTLARRRARLNLCPKCNYDRIGLAKNAKCPECGSEGASA